MYISICYCNKLLLVKQDSSNFTGMIDLVLFIFNTLPLEIFHVHLIAVRNKNN